MGIILDIYERNMENQGNRKWHKVEKKKEKHDQILHKECKKRKKKSNSEKK